MTWQSWAKGLAAAFIGGFSNGVTLMIVDPLHFNLMEWHSLLNVTLVSGLVSAAMYLKQSPVPS